MQYALCATLRCTLHPPRLGAACPYYNTGDLIKSKVFTAAPCMNLVHRTASLTLRVFSPNEQTPQAHRVFVLGATTTTCNSTKILATSASPMHASLYLHLDLTPTRELDCHRPHFVPGWRGVCLKRRSPSIIHGAMYFVQSRPGSAVTPGRPLGSGAPAGRLPPGPGYSVISHAPSSASQARVRL